MADGLEVVRIEEAMRVAGWADHTNLRRALRIWAVLSREVNSYPWTIEEYVNDLVSRDYVAAVSSQASRTLRRSISSRVALADQRFRAATVSDSDERLDRYFTVEAHYRWWWRRRPDHGPLADLLAAA